MKKTVKPHANNKGFTLIELLIVIGLLAALTALVLPSLQADREEALGGICDYNQAGTVRVLKQYNNLFNHYPNGLHTGLSVPAADTDDPIVLDTTGVMPGMPSAQSANLGPAVADSAVALTAGMVTSLNEAGITELCYGSGLNNQTIAATTHSVIALSSAWVDDGGAPYTFDGIRGNITPASGTRSWIDEDADGTADGIIAVLYIAPTTDWTHTAANVNNDWTNGNVEMEISLEGKCPIPAASVDGGDVSFAYYMAYFKVYDGTDADYPATTPAKLIGTSCPECGVLNP